MIIDEQPPDALAFACNMLALTPDERTHHMATTTHLFGTIQEVSELDNGYAFRLPAVADTLAETATFMAYERLCCPFLGFSLVVEPNLAGVWLWLTGSEGVKTFIQAELGDYLKDAVAEQAGFQVASSSLEGSV